MSAALVGGPRCGDRAPRGSGAYCEVDGALYVREGGAYAYAGGTHVVCPGCGCIHELVPWRSDCQLCGAPLFACR